MEVAIVAHQPADEGEEELPQGRVDVEEIGSLEIEGGKL